jgi:hypothetical protein
MRLSGGANRVIEYHCNICGAFNAEQARCFHREVTACQSCGSNPRIRGIVHALCTEMLGEPVILSDVPSNLAVSGLGLSDPEIYAGHFKRIFAYLNTEFYRQPSLDITSSVSCQQYLPVDFVVCADVFQRVRPPLREAFANLRSLLRPGGLLVFSVPTIAASETVEHFPNYHDASMIELGGVQILVNRTREGRVEVFEDLLSHRVGEGLEMRIFSQDRLLQHLREASFTDLVVYSDPMPEIGYYWGDLCHPLGNLLGYVLTARAA